jgi:hypothetical protein
MSAGRIPKSEWEATDFIVGTEMNYQADNNKAKIRNLQGKMAECACRGPHQPDGTSVNRRRVLPLPSAECATGSMEIHAIGRDIPFG